MSAGWFVSSCRSRLLSFVLSARSTKGFMRGIFHSVRTSPNMLLSGANCLLNNVAAIVLSLSSR